jgi:uncharacterized protein (TIGR00369 family)
VTGAGFGDDRHCFVCGERNESGLRLDPSGRDGRGYLQWNPSRDYQGYTGVLHGGIVSALLDEAMAYAAMSIAGRAATASISVSFHRPVSTDSLLSVEAEVTGQRGRVISTGARMLQGDQVMATATAKFLAVDVPGEESG